MRKALALILLLACAVTAAPPEGPAPASDARDHWAFKPVVRPAVPTVANAAWVRNPIDAFIAAEHKKRGLAPLPEAMKHALLRRVYVDLIGLPPTREQLHAFLNDASPDAYEKVVEQLLASPQYGERWGRHWMDVWRYSDWYGRRAVPDVMNSYAMIWRWRDWIVRSLNADKGYDRMVVEMLAADEVAPDDLENLPATGFIVRNWFKWNYESWKEDLVEHTGKAFLGLTLNCAQCHDHKYDPTAQDEYFRFRAFFEPLELRHDRVPGEPDPGPFQKYVYGVAYGPITSGMVRVFDEKLDAETFVYANGDSRIRIEGKPAVTPAAPAFLGGDQIKIEPVNLPPTAWYPGLKPFVRKDEADRVAGLVATSEAALSQAQQQLTAAQTQAAAAPQDAAARAAVEDAGLAVRVAEADVAYYRSALQALHARAAADDAKYLGPAPAANAVELTKAASKAERGAAVLSAKLVLARAEQALAVAKRKPQTDDQAKAELAAAEQAFASAQAVVVAAEAALAQDSDQYTPFSPTYPRQSTGRRTALARWIASKDNPLTARVAVNHIWARHFGQPLVETTFNFGRNGKSPTHPQLLDWLAAEFVERGWSMKHLHRLIVTSSAYRMRSQNRADEQAATANEAADPDNKFLWRFNPQRLEAEVVRDSVLHAAGELDATMGGPDIDFNQGLTSRRRSLYFTHHGEERMQLLELFDAANPAECYRRTETVVPQQALALANSEFTLANAKVLAQKLWQSVSQAPPARGPMDTEKAFVTAAFEQVLTRPPTDAEMEACSKFLTKQTAEPQGAAPEEAQARAREGLVHALLNHGDFVTVR